MKLFGRTGRRLRSLIKELLGRSHSSGEVFRNMLTLAAGTGVSRAIGALSMPIITRLYSPEQYGLFTLFLSTTALLLPIASLRYSVALPLPRRDDTASALLWACLFLLAGSSTLLALIFLHAAEPLFAMLSAQAVAPLWPLVVVAFITAGLYEILTNWAVREKAFRLIARAEMSQSLFGGILKIAMSATTLKSYGLMIGHVVAQAVACALLAGSASRKLAKQRRRTSRLLITLVTKRYADFPKFRLPSQLLLAFSAQAPVFFIGANFGPAAAGQLGLALVALALPLSLIGQTTGQAYYGEIARLGIHNPERILNITRGVARRLFALGLIPAVVLFAGTKWLFPLVFGARWHEAGIYASILSVYLLAQFVSRPLVNALSVLEKQYVFLRFNIVRVLLISSVFTISWALELSAYQAISIYAVVITLHFVATTLTVFSILRSAVAKQRSKHLTLGTSSTLKDK